MKTTRTPNAVSKDRCQSPMVSSVTDTNIDAMSPEIPSLKALMISGRRKSQEVPSHEDLYGEPPSTKRQKTSRLLQPYPRRCSVTRFSISQKTRLTIKQATDRAIKILQASELLDEEK